jgi:branched-chain amino acid transport system permease protein
MSDDQSPAAHDPRDPAWEKRYERTAFMVMFVLFVAMPFVIYPRFGSQLLCFAMFACAFNLLIGFGGLLSFGHAMFFGMGSYLAAHAAKVWGLPVELAILTGAAMSAVLGLLSGMLAIRRQGIYFAMITLALAQMVYFFCLQAPFTGGEDEPRAISLGYRTERYKLAAFVLSASLAGLAGAVKAIVAQNASLTDVHWSMSGEVVLMTLLGGMGTVFGPVVGALVIISMQFYLAELGSWVTITQGIIFVVCVLAFRRGIIGEIEAFLRKHRK